jgi:hypothetical protein
LEARLSAALISGGHGKVRAVVLDAADNAQSLTEEVSEAVAAAAQPALENGANVWPDETAEAAFIADARQRGEPVRAAATTIQAVEEKEDLKRALPPLADLVSRLSPEVRETLDDLFRVKFTSVRRVPKSVLKVS